MRMIYFVFLLVIGGMAALLAYENQQEVTLTFFGNAISTTLPILVGLTYLAGMLSGWTVVGIVRRSLHRVLQDPLPGEYSR
jgi:lipopolysaccharide assembly protein A